MRNDFKYTKDDRDHIAALYLASAFFSIGGAIFAMLVFRKIAFEIAMNNSQVKRHVKQVFAMWGIWFVGAAASIIAGGNDVFRTTYGLVYFTVPVAVFLAGAIQVFRNREFGLIFKNNEHMIDEYMKNSTHIIQDIPMPKPKKNKYAKIINLIVVTIILFVLNFHTFIFNNDRALIIDECEAIKDPIQRDMCYSEIAYERNDLRLCEDMNTEKARSGCIIMIATKQQNVSICRMARDIHLRDSCIYTLSAGNGFDQSERIPCDSYDSDIVREACISGQERIDTLISDTSY